MIGLFMILFFSRQWTLLECTDYEWQYQRQLIFFRDRTVRMTYEYRILLFPEDIWMYYLTKSSLITCEKDQQVYLSQFLQKTILRMKWLS